MNKTCKFRPLGQRVIVKILAPENQSPILVPDGVSDPKARQTFEVIAVGAEVNDDKFSLNVGEIVLISCHQSEILPLDFDEKLIMVGRDKIVAAMSAETQN